MIGDNLKALRIKNKLTLRDLAKEFNLSYSTIGKYERGVLTPDIEILKKYSIYFKVSVDTLLDLSYSDIGSDFLIPHHNDMVRQINSLEDNSEEKKTFFKLIQLINILSEDYLYHGKEIKDNIMQTYIKIISIFVDIKNISNNYYGENKNKDAALKAKFYDLKIELDKYVQELFDIYLE